MSAHGVPEPAGRRGGAVTGRRKVAIVGSGIAGLSCARALAPHTDLTLFEGGSHFGGHANTVDLTLDGITHGVDTGFLVFNHRTYPGLVELFAALGVETAASDMSFSVQNPVTGLEWSGTNLDGVFAQRGNLLRPRFWRMLAEIVRFNRLATGLATSGADAALDEPIGDFLDREGFGPAFREGYFLPMIGCIWSCPTDQMLRFPVGTMVRFCHNHGLIQLNDRPQWHTVRGGSRNYVRKLLDALPMGTRLELNTPVRSVRRLPPGDGTAGVTISTDRGAERFDEVVMACHSDQSLALLQNARPAETAILGAIRYHDNEAVLHTDASLLPTRRRAWAAWNYERAQHAGREQAAVCLHYLINQLQPLPWQQPVVVSLNPTPQRQPDPRKVHARFSYAHPVFDGAAVAAQRRLPEIQGDSHLWFCGAWTGYGFHEDGLRSGLETAAALLARLEAKAMLEGVAA